jgi:transmembrane adaptor Erv26
MILWVISWIATIFYFVFAVVCLAAGLYYLADIIEEYTVLAKKIIKNLIYVRCYLLVG